MIRLEIEGRGTYHLQAELFLREMNSPCQGKGTTIWREGSSRLWEDIGRFDVVANTFGRAYSPDSVPYEARKRRHSIGDKMICEHQDLHLWPRECFHVVGSNRQCVFSIGCRVRRHTRHLPEKKPMMITFKFKFNLARRPSRRHHNFHSQFTTSVDIGHPALPLTDYNILLLISFLSPRSFFAQSTVFSST